MKQVGIGTAIGWVVIFTFSMLLYGCPKYNVWRAEVKVEEQSLVGQQELERAKQNRQILIEEAEANVIKDSLDAIGEVHRAKGVAAAMAIEDGKLTDRYIKYLFVRSLNEMKEGDRIYIPTEAGLPVLEAK